MVFTSKNNDFSVYDAYVMTALELSWVCSYIAISINVTHSCFTFVPVYVVASKCILICVSYFIKAKTSDITLSLP